MTEKAKRIIHDVFNVYKKNPDQLPYKIWPRKGKTITSLYDHLTKKQQYNLDKKTFPAICNYIAGMTDRSALSEHKKLFDPFKKV